MSDKREARKEELLRKLQKNPAMRAGYVAKADQDGKGFLGWQKASTITEDGVSYLKEDSSANRAATCGEPHAEAPRTYGGDLPCVWRATYPC